MWKGSFFFFLYEMKVREKRFSFPNKNRVKLRNYDTISQIHKELEVYAILKYLRKMVMHTF